MKTFLLLAFTFSIALARVVSAEDQDQSKTKAKASKSQAKATQTTRHVVPAQNVSKAPHNNRNTVQTNQYHPKAQTSARVHNNPTVTNTHVPRTTTTVQAKTKVPNRNWQNKTRQNTTVKNQNWQNKTHQNTTVKNQNWQNKTHQNTTVNNQDWQNHNNNWNHSWEDARRRHRRVHHDRYWWRSHYTRFALFGTGYFFWDGGYWYPAYGYDPSYNTYAYNEPIYGYNDLDPSQVISNVQARLQRLGYYRYAVDGLMGPMTRAALARYQRDNGLAITSAIDRPTLGSLGFR